MTTLHAFAYATPYAAVIADSAGNLYGTTAFGGVYGLGAVFKLDASNGYAETTLHTFNLSDGAFPYAALIADSAGNLYGTTNQGGVSGTLFGYGTVFELDASNGYALTTLHTFGYSDGAYPYAGLIADSSGNLYGTTQQGGPNGTGVVFKIAVPCRFNDVPLTDPFYSYVCTIAYNGVTAGCGGGYYCPGGPVTRAQMAVFLLRARHGSGYTPPTCTGVFADVPCPGGFAADWIEQLYNEGITAGCSASPPLYCPNDAVTRAQMAVFLLRAKHGSGYRPPACVGIFDDVPCPSGFAVGWVEQLAREGVTAGCSASPRLFCPDDPNTRGQMAVFLVKTFDLQ